MSTTLAKTYLANYEALLKNESKLKELFDKSKLVQFNKLNIADIDQEEYIHLYLGYDNVNLQAILVKESDVKNGVAFENGNFKIAKFLTDLPVFTISDKERSTNPNRIFQEEYNTRVNNWNLQKQKWVEENYAKGTIVKYFKISTENYTNTSLNNFVFGYKTENVEGKATQMIDLISVLDVFADLIKPVPPFKPGY